VFPCYLSYQPKTHPIQIYSFGKCELSAINLCVSSDNP
jgi:hypothetical protein